MEYEINIIAAMTKQAQVIGNDNGLPWHIPSDLARFKGLTLFKPVIMGHRTFISLCKALKHSRALEHRYNIVLSHSKHDAQHNTIFVPSVEDALEEAKLYCCENRQSKIMIIGGSSVYEAFLPMTTRMHLTLIEDGDIWGDRHFPSWKLSEWECLERQEHIADECENYNWTYLHLVKR